MKYCIKCGTQMDDHETKCHACGARMPVSYSNKISKAVNSKMIAILLALAILFMAGSFILAKQISPGARAYRALADGNIATALEIYKDKVEGRQRQTAVFVKKMGTYFSDLEAKYKEGGITDDEMKQKAKDMLAFNVEGITEKAKKYVSDIDAIQSVEKLVAVGDYKGAILKLKGIEHDSIKYEESQVKLNEVGGLFEEQVVAKIGDPKDIESSLVAIEELNDALNVMPENANLIDKKDIITSGYVNQVINGVGEPKTTEALASAIAMIQTAQGIAPGTVELDSQLNQIAEKYVQNISNEIDSAVKNYKYDVAKTLLQSAQSLLPSNDVVKQKAAYLEEHKPAELSELKVLVSHNYNVDEDGSAVDSFGNQYTSKNIAHINASYHDGYVTFNGGFTRLNGTIAVNDSSDNYAKMALVILDENGKELYRLDNIKRTTEPLKIDLDVSSAKQITFKVENTWATNYLLLIDFMLYK